MPHARRAQESISPSFKKPFKGGGKGGTFKRPFKPRWQKAGHYVDDEDDFPDDDEHSDDFPVGSDEEAEDVADEDEAEEAEDSVEDEVSAIQLNSITAFLAEHSDRVTRQLPALSSPSAARPNV